MLPLSALQFLFKCSSFHSLSHSYEMMKVAGICIVQYALCIRKKWRKTFIHCHTPYNDYYDEMMYVFVQQDEDDEQEKKMTRRL